MGFTERDIPSQQGRTFVISGANSGIGLQATDLLTSAGARVVMACRSTHKGETARATVAHPDRVEVRSLDLADLSSVRAFVDALVEDHPRVDVLVNNAGVMALPYGRTVDGFERQIGTNHLGHFALGARLFRALDAHPERVVTVASQAHRWGRIRLHDLHRERGYHPWLAYGQSKLANLLFMRELGRRAPGVISAACHPGYASTNLQGAAARETGSSAGKAFWRWANGTVAQSARDGALCTVYAAVGDDVQTGDYIGPRGPFEMAGPPCKVSMTRRARDDEAARALWELSEELTNERFEP